MGGHRAGQQISWRKCPPSGVFILQSFIGHHSVNFARHHCLSWQNANFLLNDGSMNIPLKASNMFADFGTSGFLLFSRKVFVLTNRSFFSGQNMPSRQLDHVSSLCNSHKLSLFNQRFTLRKSFVICWWAKKWT